MKPLCLLVLGLFLTMGLTAQVDGTFTEQLFELRYQGETSKLEDFLKLHSTNSIKSSIISNELEIAFDRQLDDFVLPRHEELSDEEQFIFGTQQAFSHYRNANYLKANRILDTLNTSILNKTLSQKAELNRIRALIYMSWSTYPESLRHLALAEQIFDEKNNELGLIVTRYSRLKLLLQFQKWDLFEKEYNSTLKEHHSIIREYPAIAANFNTIEASRMFINEKVDSAFVFVRRNIQIYEQLQDSSNMMKTHLNLGFASASSNRLDEAFEHFEMSQRYKIPLASKRQEIRILISMISILSSKKYEARILKILKVSSTDDLFDEIQEKLKLVDDQDLHLHFLRQKVMFYKARKEQKGLINALDKEVDYLYDINISDTTSMQSLQYQLELQVAENKGLSLEQENTEKQNQILSLQLDKQRRAKWIYLGIFITSILFISGVWYYSNWVNKERHAKEIYALKVIETEQKLSKTELALLNFKKQTIEKNKIIAAISNDLGLNGEERTKHHEKLRQMKILTNEDWLKFQKLFNSVYPKMNAFLIENSIQLSEGELRILMLYKMNYHKTQMSEVLGIGTESVRKAIYRLKKKIEPLELDMLLVEF